VDPRQAEEEKNTQLYSRNYDVFLRVPTDQRLTSDAEIMESSEVVLDIAEVPFIPFGSLRTTSVDKIKMSDSHNMLAFTVDMENTEIMTGGVKDLAKNEYLPYFVFNNVHTMEFGAGEDPRYLYYTEATKQENRPWRVMRVDLKTAAKTIVYEDNDPTHYVDMGVTKDK